MMKKTIKGGVKKVMKDSQVKKKKETFVGRVVDEKEMIKDGK